jgi:PIN domain nuclease of toxin-antitoxin system
VSRATGQLTEASSDIRISPMVRLELRCLFEIGRVGEPPMPVLGILGAAIGLTVCTAPFPAVVREAEAHDWTRDPFDRLIVAQASLIGTPLITKDANVHGHYRHGVWD